MAAGQHVRNDEWICPSTLPARSKQGRSHLAGLLTYASTSLNCLPRIFIPVASSRLPSSRRLQLRGSDGFAPSSRTPDESTIPVTDFVVNADNRPNLTSRCVSSGIESVPRKTHLLQNRGVSNLARPMAETVAVGTIIADRPPHRSVRALVSAYGSYLG
jgi:hypothetical protein